MFGKGKVKAAPNFSGQAQDQIINPLMGEVSAAIPNFNFGNLSSAFDSPMSGQAIEKIGLQGLLGLNPNSYMQGMKGTLGQAKSALADSNQFGTQDYFSQLMSPNYLDVSNDTVLNNVLTGQAQEFLNKNLDNINASTQRSSGGALSTSTTSADQRGRAAVQASDLLSRSLMEEMQRRSGQQLAAGQQLLGENRRNAESYGNLAGMYGNLGSLLMNADMNRINSLMGYGQNFVNREQQQQMLPMQLGMDLGSLLKASQTTYQPGMWDYINNAAQFMGQNAATGAQLMAMSDIRVKSDIKEDDAKIDDFMKSLAPYEYRYIGDDDLNHGIMAQDLEKSEVGASMVVEHAGIKHVDIAKATMAALACLARINQRLMKIEEGMKDGVR